MGEACIIVAEVAAPRKSAAEAARGPVSFRLGSIAMTPVQPFHAHGGLPAAREAAAGRRWRRAAQIDGGGAVGDVGNARACVSKHSTDRTAHIPKVTTFVPPRPFIRYPYPPITDHRRGAPYRKAKTRYRADAPI